MAEGRQDPSCIELNQVVSSCVKLRALGCFSCNDTVEVDHDLGLTPVTVALSWVKKVELGVHKQVVAKVT